MKVIIAFYISNKFGSDYRVGYEYIKFAYQNGFDIAIVSDINNNLFQEDLIENDIKLKLVRIKSLIKSQKNLHRYTDFIPQTLWHLRVVNYLKKMNHEVDVLWISPSSAQAWFPLGIYEDVSKKIIWGGVGGGGVPKRSILWKFKIITVIREYLRALLDLILIISKTRLIKKNKNKYLLIARTEESKKRMQKLTNVENIPLIPEFLQIGSGRNIQKQKYKTPRFLWVGQDIPRKNFNLALDLYCELLKFYPDAELNVYGIKPKNGSYQGVIFHGWVESIDWESYKGNGVLIISSFREGLSTVLVEALENGIFCIATPVGAIQSFNLDNLVVIPESDYPILTLNFINKAVIRLNKFLNSESIIAPGIDFNDELSDYIKNYIK